MDRATVLAGDFSLSCPFIYRRIPKKIDTAYYTKNSHPTIMSTMNRIIQEHSTSLLPCKHNRDNFIHFHMAVIMKRGKVIAKSHNSIGSRSRGSGFSDRSIHAEKAVVKELGDISKLRGASLCVWRVTSINVLPSKPCNDCHLFLTKCMKEYGLRAVYYSDTIIPI